MKKNDILILLAQDCPDVTLVWDWGDVELQVNINEESYTYCLVNVPGMKIIEEGDVTSITALQRIIDEYNKR